MAAKAKLIAKAGGKSVVWSYFGLEVDSDEQILDKDVATCRTCYRVVPAKNSNTSNLFSHLHHYHPKLYREAMDAKSSKSPSQPRVEHTSTQQQTLQESMEKSQKYDRKGKKWNELTSAVTYFIAKDSLPVHTVEKPGLLNVMDSRYEVPSHTYLSRTAIPTLYTATKSKIKQEVASIDYFSATTDLWSSYGMVPYISYTLHFIDGTWNFVSRCLQTQFFAL